MREDDNKLAFFTFNVVLCISVYDILLKFLTFKK